MYRDDETRVPVAHRAALVLDKAEGFYLRLLRAVILVVATILLGFAGWLAVSSVYRISRSPDSVVEKEAAVSADELTNAAMPAAVANPQANSTASSNSVHQQYYSDFLRRYYGLYRSKFEPFRHTDDKQLSADEFDATFINTDARMQAIRKGDLRFDEDRSDLEALLKVMTEAAGRPETQQRLRKYQLAKKSPVSKQIEKTRTEYRSGWDSLSTACANWYTTPIGCAVSRPVQRAYTETVTTMEYPQGTQSQTQIFRAFQDRYFELLQGRRQENATQAENERQGILAGIAQGKLSLYTALQVVGAFLVLMFFFLLIAIERHQRRLARDDLVRHG